MVNKGEGSWRILGRLLRYARGYRTRISAAVICSVVNKLFDIAPEILIGIALDVVVNREQSFIAASGVTQPSSQIAVLGALTFLVWAGESLFEYLYLVLWRNLAQRVQADLRQDAYQHLQRQDMAFFERRSTGELVAVLNDDVNQLERFLDGGANALVQVAVTVVAVGGVFFWLSPLIALLAFTPMPLIIWGAFFFQRRAAPLYGEVRARVGALANLLANNIAGMATIKSFTAEAREAARLRAESEAYVTANRRAIAVSSAFIPAIRMAVLTGFLLTFVVGGWQALSGELNVGAYGVLVFLTQRLLWPLTGLAQIVDLFERAMASTRRILDLIETPVAINEGRGARLPRPVRGEIAMEGVSFRYPGGSGGVSGIDLHVPAGETLALVGATGSGKSTLVKLLLRFQDPDRGRVCIDGVAVDTVSFAELRGAIGLVSQEVFLFEGSVRENIAYARPGADDASIEQAARQAEAWDFIQALPAGLDTRVGERGARLSGGQRQRLSLARALLKDPPILVLDEATSAVDNETEAAIQRSLARLAHGRTLVVIAHRLSTVVAADRIVVLDEGAVRESGTHAELLAHDGRYAAQWRVQTGMAG